MTQLLAVGTAAADSADIVAAAGTPVTVFIKQTADGPADTGAVYEIKIKTAANTYHKIGELNSRTPVQVIDGPGTYRISRLATGASSGLEQS